MHLYILRSHPSGKGTLRAITRRPRWFWMWMAGQQSKPIPYGRRNYRLVLGPISVLVVIGKATEQIWDEVN